MSLRARWALALAAVAAVAVGLSISLALFVTARELRTRVDEDLRRRVAAPVELIGSLGRPAQRPGRIIALDAIAQVIAADGERVARFEGDPALPIEEADLALAAEPGRPILRDIEVDGVHHRMITAHVELRNRSGAIQLAVDVSDTDQALAALRRRLRLLGLAATAIAGGVGWWLAGRAVDPIRRLTAAAERVASTEELSADLDVDAPAEIGRLAGAFSTMLASLDRSRDQQQRLVADAGHELRTPLTALRTNLETLNRRDGELTPEQRAELTRAALSEVHQLSEITTELVDLATDARRSPEPLGEVQLGEVVERVAGRFRQRTGREIVVTDQGVRVTVREGQLERAVSNLIDNADKWSPPEGSIEVLVEGGRVEVRDHGPGIPEADLPHVFERFHRSVQARSRAGSGLGLAIVEHFVTAHGGSVFALNAPGGGAVVGFELPV